MAVTAEHYSNINDHNAFEQLSIDAHVDCKACLFLPLQPCHVVAWLGETLLRRGLWHEAARDFPCHNT